MKQRLSILSGIILLLILIFLAFSYFSQKNQLLVQDGPVELVFFPYQSEAESMLIRQGNQVILIDTGLDKKLDSLLNYLKDQEIKKIDYLILSSPEEGNIGGALNLLENIEVGQVVMPYYAKANYQWEEINALIDEKKIQRTIPTRTRRWVIGRMQLVIYPPLKKHYHDDRNYSLVSLVSYREMSMLFTGNAHKKRSEELLVTNWSEIDLYKLPNYGKENANSQLLIERIKPKIIVATAGKIDEGIEEVLVNSDIKVYRLKDQNLEFINDGKKIQSIERSKDGGKK